MTPDSENNLRLEIGNVLFIDLVGYSKLLIEDQKVSRMNHDRHVARARHEEQMDRRFQRNPAANANDCALFGKTGIEGRKGITLNVEIAAEVGFDQLRAVGDFFFEAGD